MIEPPAYVSIPKWDHPDEIDRNVVKWVNPEPPPPIGTKIIVTINRCGQAIVVGYHVEDNWLGLMVDLTDPPEWHIKQNKGDRRGVIFGPEFKLA